MWKRRFDSVVSVSGNGMSHINVRGGERWSSEPTWDEALRESHSVLLDGLLSRPEIAIMATQRSDGTVVVRSHDGEAHVRRTEVGRVDYRSVSATDPLGYDDMSGVWDADDLLAATFDTKYPDGPVQLLQTFDSPRTGDIVVSAEVGYDLRDKHESPEHKGGHGALHGDHMRVPWLSTAPLPDTPLRTVDVFGYTLQQMGMPVPEHIDGRVLTADGNVESRETRASVAAC